MLKENATYFFGEYVNIRDISEENSINKDLCMDFVVR